MEMFDDIVGITPSYVDIHCYFDSKSDWLSLKEILNFDNSSDWISKPGSKINIDKINQFSNSSEFISGSSVLATLAVLPEELKKNTLLKTTLFHDPVSKSVDTLSYRFNSDAKGKWGLKTEPFYAEGYNPVVFVLVHPESKDRIFVMVRECMDIFLDKEDKRRQKKTLLVTDLRDMNIVQLKSYFEYRISRKYTQAAISLGSSAFMVNNPQLCMKLFSLIKNNKISYLFCNKDEYDTFLSSISLKLKCDATKIEDIMYGKDIETFITDSRNGIRYVSAYDEFIVKPRKILSSNNIVSSSGAGDAVAGVILGGILSGLTTKTAMRTANLHAASVLESHLDILAFDWSKHKYR